MPVSSFASSVDPTKITQVLAGPSYGNKVFLVISNKADITPDCQSNIRYNYVFDGTTEQGKITLSLVLAAYATQKNVWLGGKNTCLLHSSVEDLGHIVVK